MVTCVTTGMTSYTTSVYVPATSGPGVFTVPLPPDTVCNGADFYVSTCGASPGYSVVTMYGDGTTDTVALASLIPRHADTRHHYGFPGTYTISQKLYDGSILVDSVTFSYDYLYCSTLPIQLYFDENANCRKDTEETNFSPALVEVDSNSVPIDTISVLSGVYYQAYGPPGTIYSFKVITPPSGTVAFCPSTGIISDTIQPYVNLYAVKYLGFYCSSTSAFDLDVHATTRLGIHSYRGNILVRNGYCTPVPTSVSLMTTPRLSYLYGSPSPASASAGTGNWSLGYVSLVNPTIIDFRMEVSSVYFTPGDTIHTNFSVGPIIGDADTTNNVINIIDTSSGSCDPNYIVVNPQGYISSGTELEYTIQFENTGNDTAFNIHIMDTLSNYEDPHSLRMVAASAEMNTAVFNVGGQNIIKFDFPHINLLDSSHHGLCDGMVVFKINTLAGLPNGTIVPNRAGIYFDDNDVVMTNTVNNIIGLPTTSVIQPGKSGVVAIYPNPASTELTIKMDNGAYDEVSITDAIGKVLIEQHLSTAINKISVESLAGGLYYLRLKGENGIVARKIIKK